MTVLRHALPAAGALAAAALADARATLAAGGLLVVPSESSYGLAVDPRSALGVAAIYALKAREAGKPLPVVVADRQQIAALGADPSDPGLELAAAAWPAALSVLLPLHASDRDLPAAAGTGAVAVRVPDHRGLRGLLVALGHPLTATSANPSGAPPLVDPDAVVAWLTAASCPRAVLLDAGVLPGGLPSTLFRLVDGRLDVLRRGRHPVEALTAALGSTVRLAPDRAVTVADV
jgi:L-threonylcarbamoyladenylate synthase